MKGFDHVAGQVLEVDDAAIYFEVAGEADRPALLFLHGGFGTIEDFTGVLEQLEGDYRVIGIDSRGHGRSTLGRQTLSYETLAKDVERVLDHLGIDTLSIVGFSDGGVVGYRLAASGTPRITSLVTIGSHWRLKPDDPARPLLAGVAGESWKNKFRWSYDTYQRLNPQPDFDRFAESVVDMWLSSDVTGYPNESVRSIDCPLLIVRGADDHLFSVTDAAELCTLVEGSTLFNIPFAGHTAFEEQRELFMAVLKQFMERQ